MALPEWEAHALRRTLVFLGMCIGLVVISAVMQRLMPSPPPGGEQVKLTVEAMVMMTMFTHGFPLLLMISSCLQAVPEGRRAAAWWFHTEVPNLFVQALWLGSALCIAASGITIAVSELALRFWGYEAGDPYQTIFSDGNRALVVALIVSAVIVAPLVEEMFFRHVLHTVIQQRSNERIADVATALLFGAAHLMPVNLPALILVGYVLQRIRARSRSLALPILTHAVFNALMLLLMFFGVYGT